jgi:carbonic anhydrase
MRRRTGRLFCAEVDGKPAGCVGIRPLLEGVCEMKRLYVDPEARGHGVGRAGAGCDPARAKELGYKQASCSTRCRPCAWR